MYNTYKGIIESRNYILSDLETRIHKTYALGHLTSEELDELLALAGANVNDTLQIDIAATLADLEQRVSALESQGVKVWTAGQVTAKGQVVLMDVTGDGVLDRCRYDGGRATTTSSPGKITGWVLLDGDTPTHTISKENGEFVLTPIE